MAKHGRFFMEFWPIFDIFHRLRPYLCSKRDVLGFYKQATHRRPGDEPLQKWSILDKNGQTWQAFQRSKVVQNGKPKCFWSFGTPLGPSGPLLTISNKNWFFTPNPTLSIWGKKLDFVWNGPKGPIWAQKGPKWPKTFGLTILVPFGPFWSTLERWRACHVWPFY